MASDDSSPRRPTLRPRAFLPLSDGDMAFSTRGQNLPALISSLGTPPVGRRVSTYRFHFGGHEDVEQGRRSEEFSRSNGDITSSRRNSDSDSVKERQQEVDRRMSTAAQILMTPEMRSQRLIGNANPRYKWYGVSRG